MKSEFNVGDMAIIIGFNYDTHRGHTRKLEEALVGTQVQIYESIKRHSNGDYTAGVRFEVNSRLLRALKFDRVRRDGILYLGGVKLAECPGNDFVPENANSLCRR